MSHFIDSNFDLFIYFDSLKRLGSVQEKSTFELGLRVINITRKMTAGL